MIVRRDEVAPPRNVAGLFLLDFRAAAGQMGDSNLATDRGQIALRFGIGRYVRHNRARLF